MRRSRTPSGSSGWAVPAYEYCCGSASVEQQVHSKAEFVEITASAILASHAHEVPITYRAPAEHTDEGLSMDKTTPPLINELQKGIFAGQTPAADHNERNGSVKRPISLARAVSNPVIVLHHNNELDRPLVTAEAGWAISPRLGAQAQNLVMHKTARDCFDGTRSKPLATIGGSEPNGVGLQQTRLHC
jgi:hypothetical protein